MDALTYCSELEEIAGKSFRSAYTARDVLDEWERMLEFFDTTVTSDHIGYQLRKNMRKWVESAQALVRQEEHPSIPIAGSLNAIAKEWLRARHGEGVPCENYNYSVGFFTMIEKTAIAVRTLLTWCGHVRGEPVRRSADLETRVFDLAGDVSPGRGDTLLQIAANTRDAIEQRFGTSYRLWQREEYAKSFQGARTHDAIVVCDASERRDADRRARGFLIGRKIDYLADPISRETQLRYRDLGIREWVIEAFGVDQNRRHSVSAELVYQAIGSYNQHRSIDLRPGGDE